MTLGISNPVYVLQQENPFLDDAISKMLVFDYVILGGGIAGLCAAQRLLELGICPLIVEAGSYPSHKVCGEFISPSSLPLLKKWHISPLPLYTACLYNSSGTFKFDFPSPAGSLSHLTLDTQLANQVSQQGATLWTHTKVLDLSPACFEGQPHHLLLSTGQKIQAKQLIVATGRLPHLSSKKPHFRYMGFKAHFSGIQLDSILHMFSFKDAYLGLVPIENGHANLACLAKLESVQKAVSPQDFMHQLVQSQPDLKALLSSSYNLFNHWMEAFVPEFGIKSPPNWPHTYWIGDAASTIPPACGNGLSLAIASGYLAAEFALKQDVAGFKKVWKKRCTSQILFGKGLHALFLHPFWNSKVMRLAQTFPFLASKMFNLTRDAGF